MTAILLLSLLIALPLTIGVLVLSFFPCLMLKPPGSHRIILKIETMKTEIIKKLTDLHACHEAVEWARTQPDWKTLWKNCQRGDWMLWIIGKFSGEPGSDARKPLVLAACECARLALKYVPAGEEIPLKAIETAESWAKDEGPTLEDVRDAAAAAYAYAAAHAYAAAYAYAAAAAVNAAAAAAAAAADDAADVAADVAADAANRETLKQCADIVRKHYPDWDILNGK